LKTSWVRPSLSRRSMKTRFPWSRYECTQPDKVTFFPVSSKRSWPQVCVLLSMAKIFHRMSPTRALGGGLGTNNLSTQHAQGSYDILQSVFSQQGFFGRFVVRGTAVWSRFWRGRWSGVRVNGGEGRFILPINTERTGTGAARTGACLKLARRKRRHAWAFFAPGPQQRRSRKPDAKEALGDSLYSLCIFLCLGFVESRLAENKSIRGQIP
jgi:hypothetical protein